MKTLEQILYGIGADALRDWGRRHDFQVTFNPLAFLAFLGVSDSLVRFLLTTAGVGGSVISTSAGFASLPAAAEDIEP
jgi:hypothetical protein